MPLEKEPLRHKKVKHDYKPPGYESYIVKHGDTWENIAARYNVDAWELIFANFQTKDPREVNWYLREYVGCKTPTVNGKNWKFSGASPGRIYVPIKKIQMPPLYIHVPPAKIAILTLVGNLKNGEGPGHSAIAVLRDVWSFEDFTQLFYGDSWLIISVKNYLHKNEWRPVVVQELNEKVSISGVLGYVGRSIQQDDDYGSSGVCSQQVAYAIDEGTASSFNPKGVDTPFRVYNQVKKQGILKRSYFYWPGEDALDWVARTRLQMQMARFYNTESAAPADGILSW